MTPLDYTNVQISGALVPLPALKDHLRVTDAAHDADVTAIGAAAQDAILRYLGAAVDPAWTDATAPRAVVHAVKILADHYYEHRGDDMGIDDADAAAWTAIRELLARHRDPTLA